MPQRRERHPSFEPEQRIDDKEYTWNFVRAEIESSRHGFRYRAVIEQELRRKLISGTPEELTDDEWTRIELALDQVRAEYWRQFLQLSPDWWKGKLRVEALSDIHVIPSRQFIAVAPSCLLGDFASALDRGAVTPGDDFSDNYRRVRPSFDPSKVVGMPVCMAKTLEGPYVEIEGLTRLSCLASMQVGGELQLQTIPLIVGVSTRLAEIGLRV